jgi:rhodanese-related sulfurtransferase
MPISELSAQAASEALLTNQNAVYLDVRTVREFEQGHPAGAYNIPVIFMEPGEPARPNSDFAAIVESHFPKSHSLIVGCQSGVRSMNACHALEELGYTDLTNVAGGFGGARDRASGQVVAEGWRDAGLPTSTAANDGRSYDELND